MKTNGSDQSTPSESPDQPKPTTRRWLTYSLRSLVALMFLACVGFTWLGYVWRAKQKERAAVAALEKLGATVDYDYHFAEDGFPLASRPDPPGPAWQRALLGDDWFAAPHCVFCWGEPFTDADLVHLRELKQLQWLYLHDTQVTDAGLIHLCELKQLRELVLQGTQVTGEGVTDLKKALPKCEIIR
ncbi:MAG: hypothetical protein N2C14_25790 [Planctomycetales bacterium]